MLSKCSTRNKKWMKSLKERENLRDMEDTVAKRKEQSVGLR